MYTPCVIAPSVGSPPHVRGKAIHGLALGVHAGITPACAGKSAKRLCGGCQLWDHPRVCGEKKIMACYKPLIRGSPPHVRGKARRVCVDTAGSRITPAHAGKSSQNEICWRRPWDHPHMCGEKGVYAMLYTGLWGSPPRMRGKGWTCSFASVKLRITPAYAGKSAVAIIW